MKKKKIERLLRILLFGAVYFLLLAYCVIFNNNAGWSLWFFWHRNIGQIGEKYFLMVSDLVGVSAASCYNSK